MSNTRMREISEFLRDLAGKCRFWSRTTLDLTIAGNLRNAATELDEKANLYAEIDCNAHEEKNPHPVKRG
jgi:hypothetical protein